MMGLVLLLSLLIGGLTLVLLLPLPVEHTLPWDDGEADVDRAGWMMDFNNRQLQLLANSGLRMDPRTFLLIRVCSVVGGALLAGLMLGPISALCGGAAGWLIFQEWLTAKRESSLLHFADQFRETLQSIANSLRAGRSMSQSMEQAYLDLIRVPGRESDLLARELSAVLEEIRLGLPMETALQGLVNRVPMEEVRLFADAVTICRVRGGNLILVLQTLVRLNIERFQVLQEIKVQTAQKRGEGSILSLMPVIMLTLLTLIAPDYMAPFTDTFAGQAVAGIGLFLVLVAFLVSRAMTRVEI